MHRSKLKSPLTCHIANVFGTVVLNYHTEWSTELDEQETNTFNFNTCSQTGLPATVHLDSRRDTISLLWIISALVDRRGVSEWRGKHRAEAAFDLHSATYQCRLFELNAEKAWLWNSSALLPNPWFQTFFFLLSLWERFRLYRENKQKLY